MVLQATRPSSRVLVVLRPHPRRGSRSVGFCEYTTAASTLVTLYTQPTRMRIMARQHMYTTLPGGRWSTKDKYVSPDWFAFDCKNIRDGYFSMGACTGLLVDRSHKVSRAVMPLVTSPLAAVLRMVRPFRKESWLLAPVGKRRPTGDYRARRRRRDKRFLQHLQPSRRTHRHRRIRQAATSGV